MNRRIQVLALALLPCALGAQSRWDSVTVRAQPLRGGVYMLTGSGGNIGLSVGPDGAFLVDDQYAPLSARILAAVRGVTTEPVKFVVNTHWHGDHTGGNENMGKAGALLVAHQNVRKRMSVEQFNAVFNNRTPASPPAALPVVTFTDSVAFHINGDDLVAFHVPPAHTDGDAIIHFTKADVVHMGDTFFNGNYPYVDVSSGGNVDGIIRAADRILASCKPTTIIIPGHGAAANCDDLREYRSMVATVRERVQSEIAKGRTKEQIMAAKITADLDPKWGRGFINGDGIVDLTYRSLSNR